MALSRERIEQMGSHQLCEELRDNIHRQIYPIIKGHESELAKQKRLEQILAEEIEGRLKDGKAAIEKLARQNVMSDEERERLKWETLNR